MGYITHRNRGTVIEKLMANTSEYYRAQGIAYFRKSNPEYMHISRRNKYYTGLPNEGNNFQIKLTSKGDLDFYGVYRGKYISIELKETMKELFPLSLVKEHQYSQFEEIHSCGGVPLLLIHFLQEDSFWIITFSQLQWLKEQGVKKIEKKELLEIKAYSVEITYPYILNLSEALDQILSKV